MKVRISKADLFEIASPNFIFFWIAWIKLLKRSLVNFAAKSWEPKITLKRDDRGNSYFQVYDPVTRWSGTFASEKEARMWLEERYYQFLK